MKNKIIYLSVFVIIVSVLVFSVMYINNYDNIIVRNGVKLALTLDEEPISSFPNFRTGQYTVNISCEDEVKGKFFPLRNSTSKEYKIFVGETNKNVECSVDFKTKTNNDLLKAKVETEGTSGIGSIVNESADNAGYRYEGQDPNNYVWFNNELWRIIGSVPVCLTANCGNSSTRLVKIIRNESIGGVAYDAKSSGYTGAWGSNTLYSLLNEYYYIPASPTINTSKSKDATGTNYCIGYIESNYSTKSHCNYTEIGIDSNSYYGQMIEKVYWNTGASNCYEENVSTVYGTEKNIQTVYNYIGLMSASDYGYATSASHSISMNNYNTDVSYTLGNWLFGNSYEWTTIQTSSRTFSVVSVDNTGSCGSRDVDTPYSTRPVVYLKDSIYIVMGDGSITNPYILAY